MVNGSFYKSDLPRIHDVVQNTMNLQSKELVLFSLRDFFAQDIFYRYVTDHYGFAQVTDVTNLPLDAGIHDDLTTRLSIQEAFKIGSEFYPALIVRSGSFTSVPISFNREAGGVQWTDMTFIDGYGNSKSFRTPKHFIFAGSWEGTINIDILARDMRSRDDLMDLVSVHFVTIAHNELLKEGLLVTGVSTSGPSEVDDRTHKVFRDTVSLKVRTEWRRHIKISNIIEVIGTAVEFGRLPDGIIASNLTIRQDQTLLEALGNL